MSEPDSFNADTGHSQGKLDREWVEQFELQLTSQQVGRSEIRRVLADVQSHCIDSGESVQEAFGDPRSYATMLAAELVSPNHRPQIWRHIMRMGPLMAGLTLAVLLAFSNDDSTFAVTVGVLLIVFVAVPAFAVSPSLWGKATARDASRPQKPAFDENGWRGLWTLLVYLPVCAVLWVWADQVVFTVPNLIAIALTVALTACGIYLTWPRKN